MRSLKRMLYFIFGLPFLTCFAVYAQQAEPPALEYSVHLAQFFYAENKTYLEVYSTVNQKSLTFVEKEGAYEAGYETVTTIVKQDSVIDFKIVQNKTDVDSLSQISEGKQLFNLSTFSLIPGEYKILFTIRDLNSEIGFEDSTKINIREFSKTNLQISDLQLACSIQPDNSPSVYVKNGYKVFPSADRIFGLHAPIAYSYLEIYNLSPVENNGTGTYRISYQILDEKGNVVKDVSAVERQKPGLSAVAVKGINVVTLHSGTYQMVVRVEDLDSKDVVMANSRFFVYRAGDFTKGKIAEQSSKEQEDKLLSYYNTLSEEQLDAEFEYTKYISKRSERSEYEKLTFKEKPQFLYDFWKERDKSPETPQNEYRLNYLGGAKYADANFKGTLRGGWKSDKGRVLMVYGTPSEVQRFPSTLEVRGYEIWVYNDVQGGVKFYFVDKNNMGEFELVHSTARKEMHDSDWERWIKPALR